MWTQVREVRHRNKGNLLYSYKESILCLNSSSPRARASPHGITHSGLICIHDRSGSSSSTLCSFTTSPTALSLMGADDQSEVDSFVDPGSCSVPSVPKEGLRPDRRTTVPGLQSGLLPYLEPA